jgi:hypothetical protein
LSEAELEPTTPKRNKLVGPGLGLVIMGASYLLWWLVFIEYAIMDPRWTHNIAYAIIILNVGLAWYHKTPISRLIAMIQAFMLPVTGSGAFNSVIITIITSFILIVWIFIVLLEKKNEKFFFEKKLSERGKRWLNMHTLIVAWLLIAHMGLMFFIVRLPLEAQLYSFDENAGYLMNLPPESYELATWTYNIGLFILISVILWEQYNIGYNIKNNPWPRKSFWIVLIIMGASIVALTLQGVIFGTDWVEVIYG